MTIPLVAEAVGVAKRSVDNWIVEAREAGNPWIRAPKRMPDLAGRAGALANAFKVKMSELGKPMSDEVAVAEATKTVADDYAVNIRAAVMDRHRKEWSGPRKIAYEAMKNNDFDKAKLAKISAETLTLIQNGESRSYGLTPESRSADAGSGIIIIEREADLQLPAPDDAKPIEGDD